ncbi:DUF3822 family protein [Haoranjiania flava]|uniref:DUF3822 family protein n=1 Tax=Haoranjiania flava TaxID=1856322 RepID=A0AAE3LM37_9BACT|nr:DUF3822 family protein [Haoranjiania flava]MCU7693401.1 DUF3822 family protein [Haoranjiania flava]
MHLKIQAIKNQHTPHRLFLEVGDDYVAACTTSSENIIAAFHLYSYKNMDDFAEILYAVKEGFAQANNELPVNVVCQNAYATCIPKEFLQESNDAGFLNKILNVPAGYEMFWSSLNDIEIAYFVDSKKLQTLKKAFPGIKITHKYSTIIHRIVNTIKADGKLLYAIFYDHTMVLAAFSNRDLQLINTYSFSGEADVVYHLLNAIKQLGFDINDTRLMLSGSIDGDSALYKQIYNFIPHIEGDTIDENLFSKEQTGAYPLHYFIPYFLNTDYFT